jgi:hypothetical protein
VNFTFINSNVSNIVRIEFSRAKMTMLKGKKGNLPMNARQPDVHGRAATSRKTAVILPEALVSS